MLDLIMAAYMHGTPSNENWSEIDVAQGQNVEISASHFPVYLGDDSAPEISGEFALVFDADSATVLYEKNADEPTPIASLTKLMTALVVTEKLTPEEGVVIPWDTRNENVLITKVIGLPVGSLMSVRDLIGGMLITSAGDAAVSLAVKVSGSEEKFVEEMNAKARELNLQRTTFEDAFGLSVGDISTPRELNWLFAYAWRKPVLREMLGAKSMKICPEGMTCYIVNSTNALLENSEFKVLGAKTGTTDLAGECVVMAVESPHGATLFVTVLKSENRWNDVKKLLRWVFENYSV